MPPRCSILLLLVVPWCCSLLGNVFMVAANNVVLDCDPCIDRSTYKLRAIVHGTSSSIFWRQVRSAAMQSAQDMRVNLEMELYEEFDAKEMATDIGEVARSPDPPDGLIVSIPSVELHDAIRDVVEAGIPVFGLNSGYEVASSLGLLGFLAMDEYLGGREAANEFLSLTNISRALFINHQAENASFEQRFAGFSKRLLEVNSSIEVDELVIDGASSPSAPAEIASTLVGCPYDAVLLGSAATLSLATSAFYTNGCLLSKYLLGTFDTNTDVYAAIAVGKLSFAVSQQQHLQGALTVVLAVLYATTGKKLAPSGESETGTYLSGPKIINIRNLPVDALQICENDGFPVCPNSQSLQDGDRESFCVCSDRSKIRLGAVTHATTITTFWDTVEAGFFQAAEDMRVELLYKKLTNDDFDILPVKMASRIRALCQEGVDGIFVSIPSEEVEAAVRECKALKVPVVSINSGVDASRELGLMHHVAQPEVSGGYFAGKKLIENGMTRGFCLRQEPSNVALTQRCEGFAAALAEVPGLTFLGIIDVPADSRALFKLIIEETVDDNGDWDGYGALTQGQTVDDLVNLRESHPKLIIGCIGFSEAINKAIDEQSVLFTLRTGPYMQGYLPVVLLAWFAYTDQALSAFPIETGPILVEASPTEEQQICETNKFEVCPEMIEVDLNQLGSVRPVGYALAAIIYVTAVTCAGWVLINRKRRVVNASQPVFLLFICAGTFVMGSTIIPISIDDGIASNEGCDKACMASPWLFTIGFSIAFSALFSKIWRINRLMDSAQTFRRVKVSEKDVMLPFAILLLLNVIFLTVWTVVDPMYWNRVAIDGSIDSYGTCVLGTGPTSVAMGVCILSINVIALLLANWQAYKARKVSTEYSESKYVAMAMGSILQILLVGIPLLVLVAENPPAYFFMQAGIIFIICMSMLLLIFVPKTLHVWRGGQRRRAVTWSQRLSSTLSADEDLNDGLRVQFYCSSCSYFARRDANFYNNKVCGLKNKIQHLVSILDGRGVATQGLLEEAGFALEMTSNEGGHSGRTNSLTERSFRTSYFDLDSTPLEDEDTIRVTFQDHVDVVEEEQTCQVLHTQSEPNLAPATDSDDQGVLPDSATPDLLNGAPEDEDSLCRDCQNAEERESNTHLRIPSEASQGLAEDSSDHCVAPGSTAHDGLKD